MPWLLNARWIGTWGNVATTVLVARKALASVLGRCLVIREATTTCSICASHQGAWKPCAVSFYAYPTLTKPSMFFRLSSAAYLPILIPIHIHIHIPIFKLYYTNSTVYSVKQCLLISFGWTLWVGLSIFSSAPSGFLSWHASLIQNVRIVQSLPVRTAQAI